MANEIANHPVALLFKKVLKDHASGELTVKSGGITRQFYFSKGRLDFAVTTHPPERLGDILFSAGRITREDYEKLGKIKRNSKRKVGKILFHITSLSMQDIYYSLLLQIKTIALAVFDLTEGEWEFVKKHPRVPGDQKYRIKVEELLVEGMNQVKGLAYYKERFLYRCPITTPIPEATGKLLSSDVIRFYIRLTNFQNVSVEEILAQKKIPEEFFWKNVILLYMLSIVDFSEFAVGEAVNENIEEIKELYDQFQGKKVNYYELFGVKKGAEVDEIKKSYFDYSRKYHPDRVQVAPDSSVMLKANAVFAEINKAFETLSDDDKKKEYDRQAEKGPREDKEQAKGRRKAKELYLRANALYKKKKFWEAAVLLEEAIRDDPSRASYYLLLGLSYSKAPATRKLAEKNFLKVAEMEPWNADPYFALGELYKLENLVKKAKVYFQKALDINMEHTLAGQAMQEMAGPAGRKKPVFSLFGKK